MTRPVSPEEAARRRQRGVALGREGNQNDLPGADCAVLCSFNADLWPPLLSEAFERAGLFANVCTAPFGQIAQAAQNPASVLYTSQPRNVIVVPAVEDLLATVFDRPSRISASEGETLVREQAAELERAMRTVLARLPDATVYLVAFGSGRVPAEHVLDSSAAARGQQVVEDWLASVREMSRLSTRVVVVDWDWHTRGTGSAAYSDDRLWYLARMRLNPAGLAALADLVVLHVAAHRGMAKKVLVLDLDNTLWGGVVGEAGLSGLALGEDGIGRAFQDFQRELLKLYDSGVLLTVASKNNPEDALEVFDRHAGMILKREHLAAMRINWQDKATNVRAIARELNLGIDSFVFLDDNPVEREWIRQGVPEVVVPELPEDPVHRPGFVRQLPFFARIEVTQADVQRAESYTAQRHRSELQANVSSFDDFLASLEQELVVEAVHPGSVGRAAQMCQRTNQFNLTTRRYTAGDIERILTEAEAELYTLAVRDRFGDSGITGLAILRYEGDTAEIDTFLLSCRVLGRKVEDAFLAILVDRARENGARYVIGSYEPTVKNVQTAGFYSDRGFTSLGDGAFRLNIAAAHLPIPPYIKVEVATHA